MDFQMTKEQKDIKQAARDFAEKEIREIAREYDQKEEFPRDLWKKACDLGFVGVYLEEAYQGPGLGYFEAALIMEQFWRVDPGCGCVLLAAFGTELIRALEEGLIAGAGIDVTLDEPIAKDNPLLTMTNVILTGHSAWYSVTSEVDLYRRPMTQVVQALAGELPIYTVNPEVKSKWMARWGKRTGGQEKRPGEMACPE